MATYNGAPYIVMQVKSILSSDIVDELIVSDDGSTDGTIDLIKQIADSRITITYGPKLGLVKNFENALTHATGDYIFLSDQDDVWMDRKVLDMTTLLETNDVVVCDAIVVDENLRQIHPSFMRLNGSRSDFFRNLIKCGYLGNCLAFRSNVLDLALPFPDHLPMHDWWIGLIGGACGRVHFLREPMVYYRRHGSNASTASVSSKTSFWRKLSWRILLLYHLGARLRMARSSFRSVARFKGL
jgi:glycosyltransferase involved in cell wall biosynthesis